MPCFLFNFDPNYIIQRDSLLFFLQNIIITIITSHVQVVKTRVFLCINSLYWMFSHLYLHSFISTALLWINNSKVFQLCLCFNCIIRLYIFIINLFILSVISNHRSNIFVDFIYHFFSIMNRTMLWVSISIYNIVISPRFLNFSHIWYCWILYLISFISFWFF